MKGPGVRGFWGVPLLAAVSVTLGAETAAPTTELETVIVTAQKRAEDIQSVPLSIQSVSGSTLEQAGVHNPVDLAKLVPSMQINNSTFGAGVIMRIRGFGSAPNTGTDSDVASYVDGAFVPRPGAIMATLLDVQNIEVLNGPQGTLSGRNAVMGAIAINSNAPSTEKRALELKVDAANYGTNSVTGVANLPVSSGFAVRIAANNSHTDGLYDNLLDGKTYGKRDTNVVRLSSKAIASDAITWTLRGDYANVTGDGVNPQAVYVDTATDAQLAALTSFNTRFGGSQQVYSKTPSYKFNQVFPGPFLRDKQYGITSDLDWTLSPKLTARMINSYRDWDNKQLAGDTVSTSLSILAVYQTERSKAQSHELQLVSDKGAYANGKLGFTSGLYFSKEDFDLYTSFNNGANFCNAVFTSLGMAALIPGCQAGQLTNSGNTHFDQAVRSTAGYVQVNYQFRPDLELDVGIRETSDKKTGNYVQTVINALAAGSLIANEGPNPLSFTDSKASYRASLSWHASDKVMLFGTYSTGYKSGGFNSGSSPAPLITATTPTARNFESETARDVEVGVKSIFLDGRWLLNATFFNTELKDFQDRSFNGASFVTRNSGNVRSRGVDLDGRILATSHVTFSYAATFLDAIYKKADKAPGLEGCTTLCPTVQDLTGETISYAPRTHAVAGVEWRSNALGNGAVFSAGASYAYTSSFLTANTNNPQSRLPGYRTTDARIALTGADQKWQLELYGTNIFDEHYYVATVAQPLGAIMGLNVATTGQTVYRGFLGDPARYGVRASYKF